MLLLILYFYIHSSFINFLCRIGVVHKLIPGLEKHRNAELAERKEKRKKQHGSEKENEKDNKEEKERSNTTDGKYAPIYFSTLIYTCTYTTVVLGVTQNATNMKLL